MSGCIACAQRPHGTSRSRIGSRVSAVIWLHLRYAHHEPLFTSTTDPGITHADMMNCLLLLSPDAHATGRARIHFAYLEGVIQLLRDKS